MLCSAAGTSAMDWQGLFFSLQGRINRIPFWIGILVLSAVIWGPLLLFGSMLPPNVPPASYGPILEASTGLIALLWLFLVVFGDFPICVKRRVTCSASLSARQQMENAPRSEAP